HQYAIPTRRSSDLDKDVPHLNYDSFFAEAIAKHNIKRFIPNSFLTARTKRYLLNKDNILLGLDKIIGSNDDIVIIGMREGYQLQEILNNSNFNNFIIHISSTEHLI